MFGKDKINFIIEGLKDLERIFSKNIFDYINFINIDDIDCKIENDKLEKNNWFKNKIDDFVQENQIKNLNSKAFSNYILNKFNNDEKEIMKKFKKAIEGQKISGSIVMNLNYLIIKEIEIFNKKEKITEKEVYKNWMKLI